MALSISVYKVEYDNVNICIHIDFYRSGFINIQCDNKGTSIETQRVRTGSIKFKYPLFELGDSIYQVKSNIENIKSTIESGNGSLSYIDQNDGSRLIQIIVDKKSDSIELNDGGYFSTYMNYKNDKNKLIKAFDDLMEITTEMDKNCKPIIRRDGNELIIEGNGYRIIGMKTDIEFYKKLRSEGKKLYDNEYIKIEIDDIIKVLEQS